MVASFFSQLSGVTFSGLETPEVSHEQNKVSVNIVKVSIWGMLSTGSIAAISFVFSRYLVHNESSRTALCNIFHATATSCALNAAIASYVLFKLVASTQSYRYLDFFQGLNKRIWVVATCSSSFGLVGAVLARLASHFVKSNGHVSFFTKHACYPLLGVSLAGTTLMFFLRWQQRQLHRRL
jgi:hypothetical protein